MGGNKKRPASLCDSIQTPSSREASANRSAAACSESKPVAIHPHEPDKETFAATRPASVHSDGELDRTSAVHQREHAASKEKKEPSAADITKRALYPQTPSEPQGKLRSDSSPDSTPTSSTYVNLSPKSAPPSYADITRRPQQSSHLPASPSSQAPPRSPHSAASPPSRPDPHSDLSAKCMPTTTLNSSSSSNSMPQPTAASEGSEDQTEQWLAKMFWEAVGDDDVDALTYKPPSASKATGPATASDSAGGKDTDSKAPAPATQAAAGQTAPASPAPAKQTISTMANGQDFWAELRRQVTALADKDKPDKEPKEKQGG